MSGPFYYHAMKIKFHFLLIMLFVACTEDLKEACNKDCNNYCNWKMNISVDLLDLNDIVLSQDVYNIFGVNNIASDDYDSSYDLAEPPSSPSVPNISLYFPHLEWIDTHPQGESQYTQDIKSSEAYSAMNAMQWDIDTYIYAYLGQFSLRYTIEFLEDEIYDIIDNAKVVLNMNGLNYDLTNNGNSITINNIQYEFSPLTINSTINVSDVCLK